MYKTRVNSVRQHYGDVIMGAIASQITRFTIVYSTFYSDADQRKHQNSASLAFVWGIHQGPVNFPHKWPVTRKMFPFDDVIMQEKCLNVCDRHRHKYQAYVRLVMWIVFMAKIYYLCHSASNHKFQAIADSPASVFARNNKSASVNLGIKNSKASKVRTHNAHLSLLSTFSTSCSTIAFAVSQKINSVCVAA